MSDISLPYSVRAMKVAVWNFGTEQYGTPVSVQNIQSCKADSETDTDVLKVRGRNIRGLAVPVGDKITLGFGGLHWPSLSIINGRTDESSGSTLLHRHHGKGGINLPYWGTILAFPLEDGGDFHLYYPLCQLTKRIPLSVEQNKFVLPEIEANVLNLELADGTEFDMYDYRVYNAETALPSDFNTAFGIS